MTSTYLALFFTVALLVTTAYFLMGGLPLLILAHDTPLDGRFIRRFFEVYYTAALVAAIGASASYGLWGQATLAAITGAIGVVVLALRRAIIPAMARLATGIQDTDSSAAAISGFRKVHALALLVNLAQLGLLVWGVVTQLSF